MVMAGYYCMKKPPFHYVYIHGTVRDMTGKKMSKSLGNIIDPLKIIEAYGTDALRYTLVTATAIGQDIFLSEERFAAGRNFANKLWNATRFVLASGETVKEADKNLAQHTLADRWIRSRLNRTIERVTASLDQFLFNDAANALYDFIWHDFCDWYLEIAKIQLQDTATRVWTNIQLRYLLETSLRLLHPIMPFVTEELWQHLEDSRSSLMIAKWPTVQKAAIDANTEADFELVQSIVTAIRNTKAELNVPVESRPSVLLTSKRHVTDKLLEANRLLIQTAAHVGEITIGPIRTRPKDAAAAMVDGVEVLIPLAGLIDVKKECRRLEQKVEETQYQLTQIEVRFKDTQFTQKAPAEVIEQTRLRQAQLQDTLKKFSSHLTVLRSM